MKITNQELHALKMPQIIIEDEQYEGISIFLEGQTMTDELNRVTLESMYRVQSTFFNLFGLCEMRERIANTINPAQQNIFMPLKSWNVNLGNCFAEISIHQRCFDGCFAEMQIL